MKYADPIRALVAGFLATIAITGLIYAGPVMGLPEMDIAALIGWFLTGLQPHPWTGGWWLGMLEHFVNGTVVFPLVYAYLVYPILPGRPSVRGLIWGAMLFLFAQAVVVPLVLCLGFFSRLYFDQQPAAVLGSLAGHLVYGLVFGLVAGQQALHLPWLLRRSRTAPAGPRPA